MNQKTNIKPMKQESKTFREGMTRQLENSGYPASLDNMGKCHIKSIKEQLDNQPESKINNLSTTDFEIKLPNSPTNEEKKIEADNKVRLETACIELINTYTKSLVGYQMYSRQIAKLWEIIDKLNNPLIIYKNDQ